MMETFEFSGDYEWARWSCGVDCAYCSAESTAVEAIGVAVNVSDDLIEVDPVCATCADGKNILMFGHKEDN